MSLKFLQVIATALVHTLKELIQDVVLLLFLILFVFGIMGFYFFGYVCMIKLL